MPEEYPKGSVEAIVAAAQAVLTTNDALEAMLEERLLAGATLLREFADANPNDYGEEDGTVHWCHFCSASTPVTVEHHADGCIWRRAREWADEL